MHTFFPPPAELRIRRSRILLSSFGKPPGAGGDLSYYGYVTVWIYYMAPHPAWILPTSLQPQFDDRLEELEAEYTLPSLHAHHVLPYSGAWRWVT
jgi:hypothetical protein